MSKAERYRQIMEQTRIRFLQDASIKMQELDASFTEYRQTSEPSESTARELAMLVHRHVHAIKGLALTLSFVEIDHICAEMTDYILNDPDKIWQSSDIRWLEQQTNELERLLAQAGSTE
ncbi:Hpt domain-containing protein [Paenibacillus kandeliae]|uniref:Hpt domain-containing protein n=1 Tax=Paenibacillus kandeliae TaxID=3231269 RepID=UPI00345A2DDD